MDLPDSIAAIGRQLAAGGDIVAADELFTAHEIFAAELARIMVQPWLAVDHVSRLGAGGDYFRFEVGPRSVVVARDGDGTIHALRNVCLHAGYRVCEEEGGHGDRLLCRYHDWEYALDGLLTEPRLRPEQPDRSRYRLPRYAVRVCGGLILADLSTAAPVPPEMPAPAVPVDLAAAVVSERRHFATTWNWKMLRQFLWRAEGLFLGADAATVGFGPLSRLWWRGPEAVLVRIAPRFAEHSDFTVIRIGGAGPAIGDRIAAALRAAGDGAASARLDRDFFAWYWSLMSAAA